MSMSLNDKLNYLHASGERDGQVILDMFTEVEIYDLYQKGLYVTLNTDALFVVYLVLLNNIQIHNKGLKGEMTIVSSHNEVAYSFDMGNKVNVMDYGRERLQRFLYHMMTKAVKEHKYSHINKQVESEIFKGTPYYVEKDSVRRIRDGIGTHTDSIILLLSTFRHYHGYDNEDVTGHDEFRIMVSAVNEEFHRLDQGEDTVKATIKSKLKDIYNFIAFGEWLVEERHVEYGIDYTTSSFRGFTDVDKEALVILEGG